MKKILYLIGGIGMAMLLSFIFLSPSEAGANPRYIAPVASTASATTTVLGMTPGAGTTTPLTYNAFSNSAATVPSDLYLLIQFSASTSSAVPAITTAALDWQVEYSYDNIDWFGEDALPTTFAVGQSAPFFHHSSTTPYHRWTMAVSTDDATTTARKLVNIKPYTQYMRVTFSNGITYSQATGNATSTQTGVWARISPIKEGSY